MSQNYKDTILLPKTEFPMKADLVKREPERLAKWEAEGLYRRIQEARKGDGLDVSDRISLHWSTADPELAAALTEHGAMISAEVLAVDYGPRPEGGAHPDAREHVEADLGLVFWLRRMAGPTSGH